MADAISGIRLEAEQLEGNAMAIAAVILIALFAIKAGQGILAGFAILFCAMILDRIVQGEHK